MIQTCLLSILLLSLDCAAQDLDAILAKNTAAHGGQEAFARIENIRYRLKIREPGFEVSGTYVATRQGNMRIDIEAGGQPVFSEGLHQGHAWQWTPGTGFEEQDDAAAAALRHGIDFPGRFFSMEEVRERGADITLVGEVAEAERPEWQLRLVLPDGFSRDYFVDQASGITVRERDYRAFHPAVDATKETVETRFENELWVGGLLYFTTTENINAENGEWLGTTEIRSVEHNVELNDSYFEPEGGL
jgi:hypothetical protein